MEEVLAGGSGDVPEAEEAGGPSRVGQYPQHDDGQHAEQGVANTKAMAARISRIVRTLRLATAGAALRDERPAHMRAHAGSPNEAMC